MKPLFSAAGHAALKKLLKQPSLFGFDLDGTLAPLVEDYREVPMDPDVSRALSDLAREQRVAIISGRSRANLSYILRRVKGLRKIILIGNHGLESPIPHFSLAKASVWMPLLRRNLGAEKGMRLEHKRFSISIQYRLVKDKRRARRLIERTIKDLIPRPRIIKGKLVYNILPDVGVNKGTAFLSLMKKLKCKRGFYIGDDKTDEDVFELNKKKVIAVRVGHSIHSMAVFYIREQKEIGHLIRSLLKTSPIEK